MRAFALLAALLLAACQPPPQAIDLPQAGVALSLPADWQLQATDQQTLLFARPTQGGAPVPSAWLMLVRHPRRSPQLPMELDNYVDICETQAQQYGLDYALLEDLPAMAGGHPARLRLRRWQGYTRARSELSLMWIDEHYGYQLTAAAEPARFAQLRPAFEHVLRSLRSQ